jgi:hypothetical protein
MRTFRSSAFVPFAFLATSILFACSSEDGSGAAASTQDGDVVYQENARLVKTAPDSITDTSLTFDANAAAAKYAVGDILASMTGGEPYYLRKITARTEAAGKVTYTTVDGSLVELFKEANIAATRELVDETPTPTPGGMQTGVKIQTVEVLPGGSRRIPFGGSKSVVQINGGGSLDMSESEVVLDKLAVDFAYNRGNNYIAPTYVGLAVQGRITIKLGGTLKGKASVSYQTEPITWTSIPLGVVTIGVVPIKVALEIESSQKYEFGGEFEAHALAGAWLQLRAGAEWSESTGIRPIWQTGSGTFYSPLTAKGAGTGSYKVYPANAKLSTRIFGVAGPYIALQPYVGAEVKFDRNGGEANGIYGIEVALGGDIKIWGYNLGEVEATLLDWKGTFPGCTNAVACTK